MEHMASFEGGRMIKHTHINEQTTHRHSKLRNQWEWCALLHPGSKGMCVCMYERKKFEKKLMQNEWF